MWDKSKRWVFGGFVGTGHFFSCFAVFLGTRKVFRYLFWNQGESFLFSRTTSSIFPAPPLSSFWIHYSKKQLVIQEIIVKKPVFYGKIFPIDFPSRENRGRLTNPCWEVESSVTSIDSSGFFFHPGFLDASNDHHGQ